MGSAKTTDLPFFNPWIGEQYQQWLKADAETNIDNICLDRLHLLGESHYSEESPSSSWTQDVIRRHACHEGPGIPFLTKALQIIDWDRAPADRAEAWSRLAYSNFLQTPLSYPREKIRFELWEEARSAFFATLAITRPNVLVCLGRRVFENLPDVGCRVPWNLAPNEEGQPINDAWLYQYETEYGRRATVAVWVYHPSAPKWFNVAEAKRRVLGVRMQYSNIMCALNDGSLFRELGQ